MPREGAEAGNVVAGDDDVIAAFAEVDADRVHARAVEAGFELQRHITDSAATSQARKQRARYIPAIDDIVGTVADEHRSGDIVVLMSNGGFGGIHRKLLKALA